MGKRPKAIFYQNNGKCGEGKNLLMVQNLLAYQSVMLEVVSWLWLAWLLLEQV